MVILTLCCFVLTSYVLCSGIALRLSDRNCNLRALASSICFFYSDAMSLPVVPTRPVSSPTDASRWY